MKLERQRLLASLLNITTRESHCLADGLRKTLIVSHLAFPLPVATCLHFLWPYVWKCTRARLNLCNQLSAFSKLLFRNVQIHVSTFSSSTLSTIPLSQITLPHSSNIIGNGNNTPWTSVLHYLQSSNATCCFHFLLQKSCFWKMGQSTVIFGPHDCERLWLSLCGPQVLVWHMILARMCPAGQRLFGSLCLSLTSSKLSAAEIKPAAVSAAYKQPRDAKWFFFFFPSCVPMKEQPNYEYSCILFLW